MHVESALLLAVVYWGCELRGSWPAMWGILVIASVVGLFLGLLVTALSRTWTTAALVLALSFLPMIALGGPFLRIPRMNPAVRLAAAAMPSRWAFEGLLVLEADASPTIQLSDDDEQPLPIDVAEPYFPAKTERMGPCAAALPWEE